MSKVITRFGSMVACVAAALTGLAPGSAAVTSGQAESAILTPMIYEPGFVSAAPPTTADCQAAVHFACYNPRQLQKAYGLSAVYARSITGKRQTIVIVDAYGSPTLRHDLAAFDKAYHLPSPPSLKVIAPLGKVPAFERTEKRLGWAAETTLDVEYAHAMAPGARILVVTLPSASTGGVSGDPVRAAVQYVVSHKLGQVITQSFGSAETSFRSKADVLSRRSALVSAQSHHVTVLASTGDQGATAPHTSSSFYLKRTVQWPSSDPLVTAVGGTTLHLDGVGNRLAPDTTWNDTATPAAQAFFGGGSKVTPLATGGGKSSIFGRPTYQKAVSSVVRSARGIPDIAMSGACDGAVLTYQSFPGTRAGWYPACGTSEAAPLFAGIVALADQAAGHALGLLNPKLYSLYAAHAPGLVDVTQGSTTVTFDQSGARHTVAGTSAHAGYDMASGVGTVDAGKLVFELAGRH